MKCDRALQLQEEGMEYDASLYYAVGDRAWRASFVDRLFRVGLILLLTLSCCAFKLHII